MSDRINEIEEQAKVILEWCRQQRLPEEERDILELRSRGGAEWEWEPWLIAHGDMNFNFVGYDDRRVHGASGMISNKVKLQNLILSRLVIPPNGGFTNAVDFLMNLGRPDSKSNELVKQAMDKTEEYILAVRNASEPNPFKDSTDDEIAGEILKRIDTRKPTKVEPK